MFYKIVRKFYSTSLFNDIEFSIETRTRGHSLKIFVKRCKLDVYKFSFFLIELSTCGTLYLKI